MSSAFTGLIDRLSEIREWVTDARGMDLELHIPDNLTLQCDDELSVLYIDLARTLHDLETLTSDIRAMHKHIEDYHIKGLVEL